MKKLLVLLVFVALLVACGGGTESPTTGASGATGSDETGPAGPEIDPDTGLVINPDLQYAQSGEEFIVDGTAISLNLTPVTSPEYLILPEGGTLRYRILGQALADTFYEDGSAVPISAFQNGIHVRATVKFDADVLPGGRYVSTNITILQDN